MSAKEIQKLIERLNIVVADQNQYTRKLTRMMLMNIGAKSIYEAADGVTALDTIRTANPDVAILDWEMPLMSGQDLIRIVRSPGVFPKPDLPIILLTAGADRLRVTKRSGWEFTSSYASRPLPVRCAIASCPFWSSRARWSKSVNITYRNCVGRPFSTDWMWFRPSDQVHPLRQGYEPGMVVSSSPISGFFCFEDLLQRTA